MGIRLLRGRAFTDADAENGEPVTIVNRTMADQFWPHADPIGQRVRLTGGFDSGGWFRIVGILDDVRHVSLTRAAVPEMYRPFAQAPVRTLTLVLKTKADPDGAAPTARSIVQTLDPTLAVYDVRTMEDRIAGSMTQLRSTMLLLMMTAALAAVLAAVAIYGSIWYAVSQRIPEIGLRLALGASRASICRTVLGRAFVLSTAGVTAGVAAAVGGAPILGGLLFDTPRTDPATYAVVIAGVLALTALASAVPARRAMRVDPITAIRT
jgi:predicted lysophospholipase L1 biosynthesis ABC-type transport system permease subunit